LKNGMVIPGIGTDW